MRVDTETPPLVMCDRALVQANNLFCGRSGQTFNIKLLLEVTEQVTTIVNPYQTQLLPLQIIGVGNVGRSPLVATYSYDPFIKLTLELFVTGKKFQPQSTASSSWITKE